jgi:hypothetical protein
MTGAHRQTDQNVVCSVLKSVRWLLLLVGFIAATLAIVGIPLYLVVTSPRLGPIVVTVIQGLVAIQLGRRLVLEVLRNRAPSPVILAEWISDSALVITWTVIVLASIGREQGRMHGAVEYAAATFLGVFLVSMPVYWWRGQHRVVLALTARSVAGRWPWSAA